MPKISSPTSRSVTIKYPTFAYLHLTILDSNTMFRQPNTQPDVDIITARTHITSALDQFLGITGTAIPIDFLKIEHADVWIRIPREDLVAVTGALGQWVSRNGELSWMIKNRGEWLGGVIAGDGRDLFDT